MTIEEFYEDSLQQAFEEYWKEAPVFPIPEEHARHKIAAKTAFYNGYLQGLSYGKLL